MIEAGIFNLLTTDPTTYALLGTRLYPIQGVPDNPDYPYVTYQDVAAHSEYTFEPTEERIKRIQFDIWCGGIDNSVSPNNYSVGRAIIIAIRNLLSGYAGTLSDGSRVIFCSRGEELDNFDVDSRSYRSVVEYEFDFSEP
jgi:hypothetical protein